MYASVRSVRLAPKKANLMAKMVRGMRAADAMELLGNTHKKSARIFEQLLRSAMANANHNFKQDPQTMIIKIVKVDQGTAYHRGIPMARGRVRPIRKFLSHIEMQLGIEEQKRAKKEKTGKKTPKAAATNAPAKASAASQPKKTKSSASSSS